MNGLKYIYKPNSNHRYYESQCSICGCDRGFKRKQFILSPCTSCAAKDRILRNGNPMQGKKHLDKQKFRKYSYNHYDYSDISIKYTESGNKCTRYHKSCPQCSADMGYHRNVDGDRVCRSCRANNLRKYTPEQKRIRSSIKANVGSRLRSRNSGKNYTSTFSMLSYTFEELLERLESQFQPGMTWDNYGKDGWEIDHIRPDSWFNYESYNDKGFTESWALENLQPLWKSDNASKSNRYEG